MKPKNFPGRKFTRRINAIKRIEQVLTSFNKHIFENTLANVKGLTLAGQEGLRTKKHR